MNKEFIDNIESLYGKYNKAQYKVVELWLNKYQGNKKVLYAEVLKAVSWGYKAPPSIADYETVGKFIKEANKEACREDLKEHGVKQIEEGTVTKEEGKVLLNSLMQKLASKRINKK